MPKKIAPAGNEGVSGTAKSRCEYTTFTPKLQAEIQLFTKPLRDNLTGLLRKLDRMEETRINQALIDCTLFLMIELSRVEQIGGRL